MSNWTAVGCPELGWAGQGSAGQRWVGPAWPGQVKFKDVLKAIGNVATMLKKMLAKLLHSFMFTRKCFVSRLLLEVTVRELSCIHACKRSFATCHYLLGERERDKERERERQTSEEHDQACPRELGPRRFGLAVQQMHLHQENMSLRLLMPSLRRG